jgi:hypothetical protein
MDQSLTIINLNEEVSNKTVELEDSKPNADNTVPSIKTVELEDSKPRTDNTVPPFPPSPLNHNICYSFSTFTSNS